MTWRMIVRCRTGRKLLNELLFVLTCCSEFRRRAPEQLFGLGGSAAGSCYALATAVSTLQKTSELLFAPAPGRKQLAAANIGSLKKNYLEVDKPELNAL